MEKQADKKSSYPKSVRVMAVAGIVILLLLYVVTFVAALTTSPQSPGLFKMSIGASILLPIIFWVYMRLAMRVSKGARDGAKELAEGGIADAARAGSRKADETEE
ncbi:hypothetical protein [Eubacterium xylanophilum]|uniref:hypothetical protein n=1 Tax=Eubacterium xylanophilum TaxID=39497 RepID=UPI0004B599D6|nr:hypothetical protein [Eubacterium xylanophilum]